jgi:LPXTG-motif cell wall-anchored protein
MDPETGQESKAPVVYTVSEAYIPGYSQSIHALENGMYEEETWAESGQFVNGESYILKTSSGCLSTVSATGNTLQFVTEAEAKESSLAIWKATVSSGLVRLENQAGQSLNFYSSGWTRYFNATTGQAGTQNFTPQSHNSGIRLYYTANGTNYYLGNLNNQNYAEAKRQSQANSALVFYPMERRNTTTVVDIDGYGFSIVNTPLTDETSLTVTKKWEHPLDDNALFEKEQVTFLLLANGVDTNRKETVNLQNNWTVTFHGLPYYDEDGEPYVYTVVELWENPDWIPVLGDVESSGGDNPTYSTTVINVYRWTNAVVLPATGGIGYPLYILIGMILISAPFVYGFSLRRRYGKGARK